MPRAVCIKFLKQTLRSLCRNIFAFRTKNHKLPVEIGRLSVMNEICNYPHNDIEIEFHMTLVGTHFKEERSKDVKPYFYRTCNPNTLKLLATDDLK